MKYKERILLFSLVFVLALINIMNISRWNSMESQNVTNNGTQSVQKSVRQTNLNHSRGASVFENQIKNNVSKGNFPIRVLPTVKTSYSSDFVNYSDPNVDYLLKKLFNFSNVMFDFGELEKIKFEELVDKLHKPVTRRRYLSGLRYPKIHSNKSWLQFQRNIHQTALYDPMETDIKNLLHDITRQRIVRTKLKSGGTQIKLLISFQNGGSALVKPMRFAREVETIPDHYYFSDYERHHAEIAAFHLDWVMGFYRVPPTAGRTINMTSEILNVAEKNLRRKFFKSPVGNLCFYGDCEYYCDAEHAICGKPDLIEGSFATFLPSLDEADRVSWLNPWRRSYSKYKKASWETNSDYCEGVKQEAIYKNNRRLVELIDMHIFDFLIGNMDRHHYQTYREFGNNTFYVHYDNGRGFGKTKHDELSILAPLYQCCQLSYETFLKLVKLYIGPRRLSDIMRKSLAKDSLNPILTESHLFALDRRVIKILKEVNKCIRKGNHIRDVIIHKPY